MIDTMTPKHIVILCHPSANSFNAAMAAKYCEVVEGCGQTAILRDLYRIDFDPVLRSTERPGLPGYSAAPAVAQELELIANAAVVVFVYPIWFGTPPAMLKGYVERVLGAGLSYGALRETASGSSVKGAHLLSLTSSGNSQIWLDEQGQWQSLNNVFDHYIERGFSMASTHHTHFSPIVEGLSERSFLQHMEEVSESARMMCSLALPKMSVARRTIPAE